MKMIALSNIYSSVGTIEKGMMFHEINPYRIEELIASGQAKPTEAVITPTGVMQVLPLAPVPATVVTIAPPKFALDWTGGTAVIICSGDSLTVEQCEDVKRWLAADDGRYAIVVNTSFRRAPFADVLYGCDGRWWKTRDKGVSYFEEARHFFRSDQMWTQEQNAARDLGIQFVKSIKGEGLSKRPGTINQGGALYGNSGYQAIGLAVLAGVKKIVLIGMDMRGNHWHGDHPAGIRARLPFKQWLEGAPRLAADLKAAGVEVINSTPNSALTVFPYVELKEVLCLPSVTSARIQSTAEKPSPPASSVRATLSLPPGVPKPRKIS